MFVKCLNDVDEQSDDLPALPRNGTYRSEVTVRTVCGERCRWFALIDDAKLRHSAVALSGVGWRREKGLNMAENDGIEREK